MLKPVKQEKTRQMLNSNKLWLPRTKQKFWQISVGSERCPLKFNFVCGLPLYTLHSSEYCVYYCFYGFTLSNRHMHEVIIHILSDFHKGTGQNKFVPRTPTLSGVEGLSKTPPVS